MSSKPLRFLGIEIDLSSKKAKDDLADWNREVREALGLSKGYADGIDDMAKEMFSYAKQTGLTKQQLKDYKETVKQSGANDFAQKTGLQTGEIKKLGKEAEETKKRVSALKGVMAGVAALGLGSIVKSIGGKLIGLAKETEKTNLSFEIMLKNKELAKEAVGMLNDFADSGAFSDTETLAVGKRLLNLKMPIGEVKETLHELGNIAAGSEMSLESLSEIYSKNKTLGVVQMNDIKQLSAQGIPIFEELGNVLGVTSGDSEELAQKIKAMSQDGVIRFDHLRQAFANMSKEGGAYAGVMDKLSQSGAGLAATFGNKLSSLKSTMGMVLLEGLKPLLAGGIKLLDWLQKSPVAMGILKTVMLTLIPIIGVLLVAALWTAATAAWGMAAGVLAATWPFIAIGAVILALILIIEDLYTWFTGGESVIGEWVEGIKEKFWAAIDFVKGGLKSALNFFKQYGKYIIMAIFPLSVLYFYWDEIVSFFKSIPEEILGFFASIPDMFGELMQGCLDKISWLASKIKGWAVSAIAMFKKYGKFLIMAIFPISILYFYWDKIASFLRSLPEKIVNFFKSIPDKIKSALGDLKELFKGLIPDKMLNFFAKINIGGKSEAIEARAGGGSVASGETYLVGECGPELFTPSRSGSIIPNNALSGAGKLANITIAPTINISSSTSDPERLADLVMKKIEELIPAISAELGLEV